MITACFFHDLKYWCGYPGEEAERLIADAELMIDIAKAGAPKMAEVMFAGVRVVFPFTDHVFAGMSFLVPALRVCLKNR